MLSHMSISICKLLSPVRFLLPFTFFVESIASILILLILGYLLCSVPFFSNTSSLGKEKGICINLTYRFVKAIHFYKALTRDNPHDL